MLQLFTHALYNCPESDRPALVSVDCVLNEDRIELDESLAVTFVRVSFAAMGADAARHCTETWENADYKLHGTRITMTPNMDKDPMAWPVDVVLFNL